jgi:hypothetical protein
MKHFVAWVLVFSGFSAAIYQIYKFIQLKYINYDTTPIRYLLNKPIKVKKRYKLSKKYNKKFNKFKKNYSFFKYKN